MVFFGVNLNMASLETITPVLAQRLYLYLVGDCRASRAFGAHPFSMRTCRLYGWGPCLNPAECPFQAWE